MERVREKKGDHEDEKDGERSRKRERERERERRGGRDDKKGEEEVTD